MKNATLRQLRIFEAVAELLSYSKAAKALHLTQPAVSIQMRQLEENAGLPLFEQIGRRIYLTAAGREMEHYARTILAQVAEAGDAFAAMKGVTGGTLNVAAISAGNYFLPQLIARFGKQHAGIQVNLIIDNRERIMRRLADNETDVAVMGRPPHADDIVAEPFAPHPHVVVASPSHPLARKRDLRLRELAGEDWIVRERGSDTRAIMTEVFAARRFEPRLAMEIPSNDTIKQAIVAGMGVGFLSAHTVGLEFETGRLVILGVRGFPVMRNWFVVHLKRKWLPPVATAFREFLLTEGEKAVAGLMAHRGRSPGRSARR